MLLNTAKKLFSLRTSNPIRQTYPRTEDILFTSLAKSMINLLLAKPAIGILSQVIRRRILARSLLHMRLMLNRMIRYTKKDLCLSTFIKKIRKDFNHSKDKSIQQFAFGKKTSGNRGLRWEKRCIQGIIINAQESSCLSILKISS